MSSDLSSTSDNRIIDVSDVYVTFGDARILKEVSLWIAEGAKVGLIGPNGSGKTTLLKTIYRQCRPTQGTVMIEGLNVYGLKSREAARKLAVVAQEVQLDFDFSVIEIVGIGRYSHQNFLHEMSEEDMIACKKALRTVGMSEFEDRSFLSLSGGEKQRVLMAAAFAQESRIIVLDEPTNHLDIFHQLKIMEALRKMDGITVFTSVHDINLAARFCDEIVVLYEGKVVAYGRPEEVLTEEIIERVFQVKVKIEKMNDDKIQVDFIRAI